MSDVLIVLVLAACATAVLAARSVSSAERARVRIPVDRRRPRSRMQEAALADHRRSVPSQGRAVDRAWRAVAYGRGWLSTRHSLPIEMAMVARYARHRITRLAGLAYPPFVLFVIVATGNHFLADAAAGAAVAAVALLGARLLVTPQSNPGLPLLQPPVWAATPNPRAQAAAEEHRAA